MVGPITVVLEFGPQPPAALIFYRPHLPLCAVLGSMCPSMLVAHAAIQGPESFFGKGIDALAGQA